jgi:hypothetical protein
MQEPLFLLLLVMASSTGQWQVLGQLGNRHIKTAWKLADLKDEIQSIVDSGSLPVVLKFGLSACFLVYADSRGNQDINAFVKSYVEHVPGAGYHPQPQFYQVIQPDVACRLYLDVECFHLRGEHEEQEFFQLLVKFLEKYLAEGLAGDAESDVESKENESLLSEQLGVRRVDRGSRWVTKKGSKDERNFKSSFHIFYPNIIVQSISVRFNFKFIVTVCFAPYSTSESVIAYGRSCGTSSSRYVRSA